MKTFTITEHLGRKYFSYVYHSVEFLFPSIHSFWFGIGENMFTIKSAGKTEVVRTYFRTTDDTNTYFKTSFSSSNLILLAEELSVGGRVEFLAKNFCKKRKSVMEYIQQYFLKYTVEKKVVGINTDDFFGPYMKMSGVQYDYRTEESEAKLFLEFLYYLAHYNDVFPNLYKEKLKQLLHVHLDKILSYYWYRLSDERRLPRQKFMTSEELRQNIVEAFLRKKITV